MIQYIRSCGWTDVQFAFGLDDVSRYVEDGYVDEKGQKARRGVAPDWNPHVYIASTRRFLLQILLTLQSSLHTVEQVHFSQGNERILATGGVILCDYGGVWYKLPPVMWVWW